MTTETVDYVVEEPFTGRKRTTKLRAKAIRYYKQNYYITERRLVETLISTRETLTVLHVKIWKPKY